MRSALYWFALFVALGAAGCSNLPNPDAILNTPTATAALPLAAAAPVNSPVLKATATIGTTRTPRPSAPTETPPPPATLVIEGQAIPLPNNAVETKNIPTEVRNFAATQFRGLTRVGTAHAYLIANAPDGFASSFSSDLTAQGWENVPMQTGLPNGISAIIAQKGTVRATFILYAEENARTLVYVVLTQR